PGGIRLLEREHVLFRTAAGQLARALGEGARPPLAERRYVRAAFLGEDVGRVMVAPGEQRDLALDQRIAVGAERHVVERAVLEAPRRVDAEALDGSAQPEEQRIEEVRAE